MLAIWIFAIATVASVVGAAMLMFVMFENGESLFMSRRSSNTTYKVLVVIGFVLIVIGGIVERMFWPVMTVIFAQHLGIHM